MQSKRCGLEEEIFLGYHVDDLAGKWRDMRDWMLPKDLRPVKGIHFVEVLRRGPPRFESSGMVVEPQRVSPHGAVGRELEAYEGNKQGGHMWKG